MKYKYNYSNSQSSIEEVEQALKADYTPDRCRNKTVANNTKLSEASVNIHLHELESRGKALKLGSKWIHLDTALDLQTWQLKRILEELDREHSQAVHLENRLQEKVESRKEYLQEMKDELRKDEFKRQQKSVLRLESSRNYYNRKRESLRRDKMKVFGLLNKVNSKETGEEEVRRTKSIPVPA